MSAGMMSRQLNAACVNAIFNVSLDTTPTYVLADVIGVVEPLEKKTSLPSEIHFNIKNEVAVKVTMPWGYLHVLLLNVKGHSNICHLFLYCV